MKKSLLFLAAVGVSASMAAIKQNVNDAWLQEYQSAFPPATVLNTQIFKDYTPEWFRVHSATDINLDQMIRTDITAPSSPAPNLGNGSLISSNTNGGKNYFNAENLKKGNLVFGGQSPARQSMWRKGFSTFDFGGDIGTVMIINGKDSKLAESIKENFGLTSVPEIPALEEAWPNNLQLFWILDHLTMKADGLTNAKKLRVRMEVNIYNNDMSSAKQGFYYLQFLLESNTGTEYKYGSDAVTINEFAKRSGDLDPSASTYGTAATSQWNPNRWMVYEFDINYQDGCYLRQLFDKGQSDFDNSAILIRALEVFAFDPAEYEGFNDSNIHRSWRDYSIYETSDYTYEPEPETPTNITAIALSHSQEGTLMLSAGEEDTITLLVTTNDGEAPYPANDFSVVFENNDGGHVIAGNVGADQTFTVKISDKANANDRPVRLSVVNHRISSDPVEILHFGAPQGLSLTAENLDGSEFSFSEKDINAETIVTISNGEDAYEGVHISVTSPADEADRCADIIEGMHLYSFAIVPVKTGEMTLAVTPLLAGEHLTAAETLAGSASTFTVKVAAADQPGTDGIVDISILDEAGAVLYNLQGVRVNEPTPGIYIRHDGTSTSKVIVK